MSTHHQASSGCGGCGCHASHAPAHTEPHHDHGHDEHGHDHGTGGWLSQSRLIVLTGAALLLAYGASWQWPALHHWIFWPVIAVCILPIARHALAGLRRGQVFSIETLMLVATIGAVLIGASEEAAAVIFLFQIGEALEGLASRRAQAGIRALAALLPSEARCETPDGSLTLRPADQVHVGDVVQVRAGDRIPVDGEVISGDSTINEAALTGESQPRHKSTGDAVFAGTIALDGTLRLRVTQDPGQTTLARIVAVVQQAQRQKAPVARFTERFARLYTPLVVAGAAVVALTPPLLFDGDWQTWIYRGLAVLLIGCPCALVISTPAAIASGLSVGARHGLLMKGGAVLEALGQVTTVAFDKTGTLTNGTPRVSDLLCLRDSPAEVLALAAGMAQEASHPVALAIIDAVQEQQVSAVPVTDSRTLGGKGMLARWQDQEVFLGGIAAAQDHWPGLVVPPQAEQFRQHGKSVSLLVCAGVVWAVFAAEDSLRPDAKEGVAALARRGISMMMLTGDHQAAAERVGSALGIPVHADLLPTDKMHLIEQRQAAGERVAKVGDGINDAPGLAAAHVGIAMGAATDVALETADAASLHGRVGDIAAMISLSRQTLRTIYQNVALALGLKGVFLVLTVAGVTGLWPAVLADTGATVLVTANALRLLRLRL